VVLNIKITKKLPRRGKRSGNGKPRRLQPMPISSRIQATTATIVILMVTPKKNVGNYIQI
jgi:hypothetical protein